ncbi:MAG TPA: cupredoxin domain-containing protein [Candidatus Eisenbacteria bacterium]|jgi:uncharacterized cupredoxin-like copper-binding protein
MRPLHVVAAIAFLLSSGCASGLKRPVTTVEAATDASGVQVVSLDLHSFYFKPNRIVVHAGRPVELVIHNRSLLVPHNFTIAEASVSESVSKWGPGTRRVRFTPTEAGEFKFWCHVDSHAKKGMTGTLVVLP